MLLLTGRMRTVDSLNLSTGGNVYEHYNIRKVWVGVKIIVIEKKKKTTSFANSFMHSVTQSVTQQLACSLQVLMAIQKQVEQTLHSLHSGHAQM